IQGGLDDTCALTNAGAVLCWGANNLGQLGTLNATQSNLPVTVPGVQSGIAEVATGYRHNCAMTSGGGVLCWGANNFGQLGNNSTKNSSTPVPVVGIAGNGLLQLY